MVPDEELQEHSTGDPDTEDSSPRRFVVVKPETETDHVFKGQSPSHALRKAARRLIDSDGVEEPEVAKNENSCEIRLRERGTDTIHVYTAWAWERPREPSEPDWLNDMVCEVALEKRGSF